MALWSESLEDRTLLSVDLSVIDINDSSSGLSGDTPFYGQTAVVGDRLYYVDLDTQYGLELHALDTITGAASVVLDVNPGLDGSDVGRYGGFTVAGDKLYFSANDPSNGTELRWIDTTETAPTLHTLDIYSGSGSSSAGLYGGFTVVGNHLYFTARDSDSGTELRWIDTTETIPTLHTIDIRSSGDSNAGQYGGLTAVGDKLYFTAWNDVYGHELHWIENAATTPILHTLDIADGGGNSFAGQNGGFTVVRNNLYFTAYDLLNGYELRWIDTTETTPVLHTVDIYSGSNDSNAGKYGGYVAAGNNLYFSAEDSNGYELHWIDTTEATPTLHALDIYSGSSDSYAGQYGGFIVGGDNLYFTAQDLTNGTELRWIDTTETNPTLHTLDIYSGASSSNAGLYGGFAVVGDKLYFTAFDPSSGYELRWIDTTEPTPILVTFKIISGNKSSFPGEFGGFTVVGNKMYFTAITLSSILGRSYELCWIDTTEATPTLHTLDIYSGSRSSNPGQYSGLTVVGDKLYFTATDASSGYELRWIDAYPVASNLHVLDLYPGSDSSYAGVYGGLTVVGDKLYFTAQDSNGYELRWIDTTETIPTLHTLDIYSGSNSSSAGKYGGLKAVGDNLYFTAYDPFNGYELRWIDTTELTPTLHTLNIAAGNSSSYAGEYGGFTTVGNNLYFTAFDVTNGYELRWINTAEESPTIHTLDIFVGSSDSRAGEYGGFAVVEDKLFFTAIDATSGGELRWIDTTQTGPTLHTIEIYPGDGNSNAGQYGGFTVVGNNLYFTASDPISGYELRWVDTNEATPALHTLDIFAGSSDSLAGEYGGFAVVEDKLFFTATDPTTGNELRWIDTNEVTPTLRTLDINRGSNGSNAGQYGGFMRVGNNLYFTAADSSSGYELRWIDTTEVTPELVTLDLTSGRSGSYAGRYGGFKAVGSNLYYSSYLGRFGHELAVLQISVAPTITVGNLDSTNSNNGNPVTIDAIAMAIDDNGDADWDGGSLAIQITANAEPADEISLIDVGNISVNRTTGEISHGGIHFATASIVTATVTGGTVLTINFNSNATNARVQDLVRAIAYRTTSTNPTGGDRTVTFTVTDNTSLTGSDTATITVTALNSLPAITLTPLVTTLLKDTSTGSRIRVASVTVTDDALGANILSLTGDDSALFEIDGMDLYLKAGTVLDSHANPVLDVTVNVDDASLGGSPDDSDSLQVVITDRADLVLFDTATGLWRMGTSNGTSFTWANGPKWNAAVGWTTFTGDYNGDGLTDGIGITSANKVFVARNNGDGTMSTLSAGSFSALETFQYMLVGDFNGDGRDDLIVQQATNNTTPLPGSWFVKSFNGSSFSTSFYGRWDASGWGDFGVGDVNQDGIDDIIGVRNAIEGVDRVNWMYGISNQIPDGSRRFFAQFAGAFTGRIETAGWHSVLVGDWDNDGRADVAARRNDGRFIYGTATGDPTPYAPIGAKRLVNSAGPLFSNSAFSEPFLVGDFNGDGRDDILTRQTNNKNLWVAQTNSTAPTSATVSGWGPWDDTLNWSGAAIGDFNGDGRDDYASIDLTGSHAWVSLSTGSTFQPAVDFGLVIGTEFLVGPLKLKAGLLD
ncbi:MAG: VCBS repeat-containing protein [Planctomycetaceae bacterium]|nr:VCBS repeat-containing protein [Planctomycetaceae bacterium]